MFDPTLKDFNMLSIIVKTLVAAITFIVSVTLFFGDIRNLPPRVNSLESRVAALELNYATGMTRIEVGLTTIKDDFKIIKEQITRLGMEKDLTKSK